MKTRIFVLALTLSSGYFLTSCKEQANDGHTAVEAEVTPAIQQENKETVSLTFASTGYADRAQGADWVKIIIQEQGADNVQISITSRDDIKKPTCSLETEATRVNETTYQAILQAVKVNFIVTNNQLSIDTENEGDRGVLAYYCSGGGTLVGTYTAVE